MPPRPRVVAPSFFHYSITRSRHSSFENLTLGRLTKLSKREDYSRRVLINHLLALHWPAVNSPIMHRCNAHARTPQSNPCQLSPNNSVKSSDLASRKQNTRFLNRLLAAKRRCSQLTIWRTRQTAWTFAVFLYFLGKETQSVRILQGGQSTSSVVPCFRGPEKAYLQDKYKNGSHIVVIFYEKKNLSIKKYRTIQNTLTKRKITTNSWDILRLQTPIGEVISRTTTSILIYLGLPAHADIRRTRCMQ